MSISPAQDNQSNGKNNEKTLIGHVVNDLGGVFFAVEAIDKTFDFASKAFKNNKAYQNSIRICRGLSPVILTVNKIYNSTKIYFEKKKQIYAREKKNNIILRLMKLEHLDEYELDYYEFNVGKEIISWFMERPSTKDFKIVDFFNNEFESVSTKNIEKGTSYILIENDNNKYMIEVDLDVFNGQISISSCFIHTNSRFEKVSELKTKIFSEFINHFDTKNNIIEMNARGLKTRSRMDFNYDIHQFDVNTFSSEIKKSILKRKKRGYIMAGPPGVGKSTVIIKLEKELPDIPIIYISSSGSSFREDIVQIFNFLRSISPCIGVFEDLDSYELSNKQDRIFGEFIEQMDSLKHKECIIIIATLNEPENIHASLINRRGRFDKVYFIDFPKTEDEILSVMKNKYDKEFGKKLPFDSLEKDIIDKIIANNFSHSDICEVVESLFINDIPFNKQNIKKSIEEVISTMKAVSKCVNDEKD
jgi:hypothetical protein